MAKDLIDSQASWVPDLLIGGGYSFIRSKILENAKFDLDKVAPVKYIKNIKIPAFFITSKKDKLINP